MSAESPVPGAIERHAQTVIGSLVLAAILGSGSILLDLRDRVSRNEERQALQFTNLATQVATVTTQVASMKDQIQATNAEKYTTSDARRDLDVVNRRLLVMEADRAATQAAAAAKAAATSVVVELPKKP